MILILMLQSVAWAHSNDVSTGRLGWHSWNWPPWVLFQLFSLSSLYASGWSRMVAKRGEKRKMARAQLISFYLGVFFIFIALCSPIDAYSDVLSWVHMVQHTLLMMVAAPLLVFGSPAYFFLWATPRTLLARFRLPKFRGLSRPVVIWLLYAWTLWILHLPRIYEKVLKIPWVHDLQHLAFFGSAFLFWRITLDPYLRRRLSPAAGILYLFTASLHAMILGVLMAVSPRTWYRWYEETAPRYGFSALEDQQIAGYIMWMPAGLTFVLVAVFLLTQAIRTRTDTITNS